MNVITAKMLEADALPEPSTAGQRCGDYTSGTDLTRRKENLMS